MRTRTKSLFSMMKKLLRLGDMARGGRRHDQVFDLLGMRAVVQPRQDLPPDEVRRPHSLLRRNHFQPTRSALSSATSTTSASASDDLTTASLLLLMSLAQAERLATQACYVVQDVAQRLWHVVPGRSKDYIARPKASGYASLHLTICMHSVVQRASASSSSSAPSSGAAQQPHGGGGGECSDAWLPQRQSAPSDGGSSSSGDDGGSSGERGGLERGGVAAPRAAAYLELQVRTQSMDDRAEMGEASHSSYKGGLDARQARLLHDWSRELHARLRLARGGAGAGGAYKLLLPPSVVAQQVGAFSLLDSVDLDGDVVQLPPSGASSSSAAWAGGSWYSGGAGGSSGSQGSGQGAEAGARGDASWPPPSTSGPSSPYVSLFNAFDRDGNGRLSVEELREQLRELGVPSWSPAAATPPAPATPAADLAASPPPPPAVLRRGSTPGIITFDAAADAEAIDAWVRMTEAGAREQQQLEEEEMQEGDAGGTSALAQAPGFMTSQELTFQEFAQLLKQVTAGDCLVPGRVAELS